MDGLGKVILEIYASWNVELWHCMWINNINSSVAITYTILVNVHTSISNTSTTQQINAPHTVKLIRKNKLISCVPGVLHCTAPAWHGLAGIINNLISHDTIGFLEIKKKIQKLKCAYMNLDLYSSAGIRLPPHFQVFTVACTCTCTWTYKSILARIKWHSRSTQVSGPNLLLVVHTCTYNMYTYMYS